MTGDTFEAAATRYERLAGAAHYRGRNVPRGRAHAFAAQGHMRNARQLLDDLAVLHASESRPEL